MPGFVDFKTFVATDGERLSVIVFDTIAHPHAWRDEPEHRAAQQRGRDIFYSEYSIVVCQELTRRSFQAERNLARAAGVIGIRLVPLLVSADHEVAGMTRSHDKAAQIDALGAQPVICDAFDTASLLDAVSAFAPDLVMHQLTDLPDRVDQIPEYSARNNRSRTEGTRNLLAAAGVAGAHRFLAQSIAWASPGSRNAVAEHERQVLDASGVVVRYGQLYGPGTYYPDDLPAPPRIHVEDAAGRTMALLDAPSGIMVLTDEDDGVSNLAP